MNPKTEMAAILNHTRVEDPKTRIGTILHGNIGTYRIIELLASGGQADVYRVTVTSGDTEDKQRSYAAKWYIDPTDARQERTILTQLDHPNIVKLFDNAQIQNSQEVNIFGWSSASLSSMLQSGRKFDEDEIDQVVSDISSALEYMHARNIIHGDVKPSNILMNDTSEGFILSDFGCARQLDGQWVSSIMFVPGTIPYRAPEQQRHDELTPATDQYSFALLLAELMMGHGFLSSRFRTYVDFIDFNAIESEIEGTPFEATFRKALSIDVHDRYDSVADFSSEILSSLEEIRTLMASEDSKFVTGTINPEADRTMPYVPSRSRDIGDEFNEITQLGSVYAALPDDLMKYRAELLEQIDIYSEKAVLLLLYKSKLQQECLDRLQQARMNLMEIPDALPGTGNVESFRRRILDTMYELRLIHVIITREQNSQDGEKTWRWIVPILVISYITAIVLSIVVGQRYFTNQTEIPLLGVPVSIVLWAAVGSLGAILYRFYTRQPGRLADEVRWLVARPIIGIIMGALGYLTVLSGIFAFGGASAADAASNARPQLMWLVAFLGGFSDRFFESVIEGVIGRFSSDSK